MLLKISAKEKVSLRSHREADIFCYRQSIEFLLKKSIDIG